MEHNQEYRALQAYAALAKTRVLTNQADLDPKDRAMPSMLAWCRRQIDEPLVVLQSGLILASHPTSRVVHSCKIVMQQQGIKPSNIFPATRELIAILLDNANENIQYEKSHPQNVSVQQQRLRLLVKEALDLEASDIHIEVREKLAKIRFRKHGELFLHAEWLPILAREVVSVAFNKETDHAISHFNPLVPQNAAMPLKIGTQEVRLRLASLPAHGGFDVVLRLLTTKEEKIASLKELGYLPDQIALLERACQMPYGAVIVSGPTGSGKTTTLASCMNLIRHERKIYTIEDPVEKQIESATQIPVNTEHYDRSFASMARTTLRMDPDVIVLGEMRDEDTASVMMRAAITGHLVFSTLHTNSAPAVVTRLKDLGVSTSLLASPGLLVCLVCQRLAPLLCHSCATPLLQANLPAAILQRYQTLFSKQLDRIRLRGETACRDCHGLGIKGRSIVAEVVWMDDQGREFVQNGNHFAWHQYLKDQGWRSYGQHLLQLVQKGRVDPRDAEKMLGHFSVEEISMPFVYQMRDTS